jgi:hypothetical protein
MKRLVRGILLVIAWNSVALPRPRIVILSHLPVPSVDGPGETERLEPNFNPVNRVGIRAHVDNCYRIK